MQRNNLNRNGIGVAKRFGLAGVLAAGILTGALAQVRAGDDDGYTSKARVGLKIAPVPLNLRGKDPSLVGLGSYIVNAQGSCNACHNRGEATEYAAGGNPFFGQRPQKVNAATYLAGGRDFGPLIPNSPNIVSRNLTPDKSGRPMGETFPQFLQTMRTGVDRDHVHPACSIGSAGACLPPPFDGELLQIMPWPIFQGMTNQDLFAVYEYLRAIPCIEGGPGEEGKRCE